MKIVFFGTSQFSAEILAFLKTLPVEIVAIVTRTDKPQGRDLKLGMSPVKEMANSLFPNVPLFQPEKASTDEFSEILKSFDADVFFVVAYGEILRSNILSLPSKACINVHTSLLPKYRGAAPIQRCLMSGEPVSGVTFMEMALKMDAGDILLQEKVEITPEMNAFFLEEALLEASKKRLPEFLDHFDSYYSQKAVQEESLVSFAAKIGPDDCVMNWEKNAQELQNQIRGLAPFPAAYVKVQFGSQIKRLKILKSKVHLQNHSHRPGDVWIQNSSLFIAAAEGFLELLEVQLEGKKMMKVEDFLRGVPTRFHLAL